MQLSSFLRSNVFIHRILPKRKNKVFQVTLAGICILLVANSFRLVRYKTIKDGFSRVIGRNFLSQQRLNLDKYGAWVRSAALPRNETDLLERLQNSVPNIPFRFLHEKKKANDPSVASAFARLPGFSDLRVGQSVWSH